MKPITRCLAAVASLCIAVLLGACTTLPADPSAGVPTPTARALRQAPDRALEDRILALDPTRITDRDVRETLARGPTPHIMLLHGGVYPVHLLMESFSEFLAGMGYPLDRIRDPGDGSLSRSPYEGSDRQAGSLPWYYERDGARPMLVGHSQGGIQAVKILHDLDGTFGDGLRVFDPKAGAFESRATFVDPLTGREHPLREFSVSYVSVIGTGGWSLALPFHWMVLPHVRSIPVNVEEFVGYRIGLDFFAMDVPGLEGLKTFYSDGNGLVRNVTLPAGISHVFVPGTAGLAQNPAMRAWLNDYHPDAAARQPPPPDPDADNVPWAADNWFNIKRHWALEAQRFVRARRGG